jgi:hypothetical protein
MLLDDKTVSVLRIGMDYSHIRTKIPREEIWYATDPPNDYR